MDLSKLNVLRLVLTIAVAAVVAFGMNHFLNILVQSKGDASITQKQTWKSAGKDVEKYFEDDFTDTLKQKFESWTLYDFSAIAAAILLIIVGLILPGFLSLGFVFGGLLLLLMRLQSPSMLLNLIIGLLCALFAFFAIRRRI